MALVRVAGFPALDTALIVVPRQPRPRAGDTAILDGELPESATVEAAVVAPGEGAGPSVPRPRTTSAGRRRKRSRRKRGSAGAR
jgi:hypothetical protein